MPISTTPRGVRRFIALFALVTALGFTAAPQHMYAQGAYSISTVTADNGFDVIMFEITAQQSVRLHRFWNTFSTGSGTAEVWARYGGIVANDNTGWQFVGQATINATSSTAYTEIPLNLDFLINANETWGFAIFCSTPGVRYRSGTTPYVFSDSFLSVNTQSYGGSGTTNPGAGTVNFDFGNYPRQFSGKITYDEGITGPNDAGIAAIESPKNFCAGQEDVIVRLRNYGTEPLTDATINWTLNGTPQPAVSWSGMLDTLNSSTRETSVTLATMNFQANVPYTITAWTTMPNGVPDTIKNNDTASVTVQAAIAGTFTIGGASPDYATISDAVGDLVHFGVCGPVTFDIRPGTYNEQIALDPIPGASSVNTVTFRSETGNKADVDITFASTSSSGNYTVMFNGATFVTFEQVTISATGSSYAYAVLIEGTSTDNTLRNCELVGVTTSSTSSDRAVVYSPSGTLNHRTVIRDCGIRNGSYGIYMYGSSSSALEEDVLIKGNEFTGQYYRPFYSYYLQRLNFHDNRIDFQSTYSGAYFAYTYNNADISVERNSLFSDGGGTRYGFYFGSTDGSNNRFVNNFVTVINNGSSTAYGLYLSSAANVLVAHNSIYINSTSTSSGRCIYQTGGSGVTFLNNILHNDGDGYSLYSSTTSAVVESDYNVLYSNGKNLAYWSGAKADLPTLQASSGMDNNSIVKPVTFANYPTGDLHLDGPSEEDQDLYGTLLAEVTDDIDGDLRVNPYRGADEACYILPGSLTYEFVDGSGMQTAYAEAPGSIGVRYGVSFPDYAATVTFTVQFYNVKTSTLTYQTSFTASKLAGVPLQGVQYITLPHSLSSGTYRMEVIFNAKNSCGTYRDYMPYATSLLLVPQGRVPCVVWPGDANNDGVVNYADRRALNSYMYEANMRTSWLNGPARYRPDAETNPYTYMAWEPQASAPWQTDDGCYMDTDGNGVVNNLDYIAMKLNWSKTTPWFAGNSKADAPVGAATFLMDQNYPNPFNPSTVIRYHVAEASNVRLVVTDAMGRVVSELENGRVEKGTHETTFDGSSLSSGTYITTITVTGIESGMTFTKTIKMALSK